MIRDHLTLEISRSVLGPHNLLLPPEIHGTKCSVWFLFSSLFWLIWMQWGSRHVNSPHGHTEMDRFPKRDTGWEVEALACQQPNCWVGPLFLCLPSHSTHLIRNCTSAFTIPWSWRHDSETHTCRPPFAYFFFGFTFPTPFYADIPRSSPMTSSAWHLQPWRQDTTSLYPPSTLPFKYHIGKVEG